jgi:hypothetical protein
MKSLIILKLLLSINPSLNSKYEVQYTNVCIIMLKTSKHFDITSVMIK